MAEEAPGAAGGGAAAGVTLGFALAAKPKRAKVSVQVAEKQEEKVLITGIEGSRIKTAAPEAGPAGPRVIAAIGNTYRAGVGRAAPGGGGGFVPSFKPPAAEDALATSNEEKFVAAPTDDGTKPTVAKYGLQRMGGQKAGGPDAAEQQQQAEEGDHQDRGRAQDSQQQRGGTEQAARPAYAARGRGNDKQQLMEELGELPDEMETEAYEATPVDEFAKALLRGMGWREGEGVGRSKQTVEVKQIVPRPDRLGLGADPAALPQRPKVVKMGDKPKQDLVAAPTADGRARHRVGLDEKLVPREETLPGPRPGKAMRVVAGRHAGFACVVKEVLPKVEGRSDRALVELLPSHEEVEVRVSELGEQGAAAAAERPSSRGAGGGGSREREGGRGSERERERERGGSSRNREREREPDRSRARGHSRERERERNGGSTKRDRSRDRGDGRQGGSSGGGGGGGSKRHRDDRGRAQQHRRHGSESSSSSEDDTPPPAAKPTWLFPNIRVRLLSKRLAGGTLYLKKGVVVDVHPGAIADVAVEETRRVVQLPESELETVVPKDSGRPVQVVAGRWRGRRGRLLQASRSSGVAAVQLAGDMEVVRLSLDDVAEYMGSLDEEGDDG